MKYKNVEFTGRINDEELYIEIQNAKYLILLSMYEGFGLPPLEALYLGTQPIISNIEIFREIYENLPVLFLNDIDDLSDYVNRKPDIFNCKKEILAKYNYSNFASKIIEKICNAL